jgi:hypothetical protein
MNHPSSDTLLEADIMPMQRTPRMVQYTDEKKSPVTTKNSSSSRKQPRKKISDNVYVIRIRNPMVNSQMVSCLQKVIGNHTLLTGPYYDNSKNHIYMLIPNVHSQSLATSSAVTNPLSNIKIQNILALPFVVSCEYTTHPFSIVNHISL